MKPCLQLKYCIYNQLEKNEKPLKIRVYWGLNFKLIWRKSKFKISDILKQKYCFLYEVSLSQSPLDATRCKASVATALPAND